MEGIKHCQSCGMPLYAGIHGTDAGGMRIEDYCVHCYRDGGFTSQVTMDEMMRLCANYVDGNRRFYIANMRMLYPHLKRWAKKEDTQSEYYKSVNRVMDYLKENLHENAGLKTLASIANISPYHFHRIFKAVIGESLAEYVLRQRMEYVAGQLKTSDASLAQLAERTGYSSEQALSRAFKSYFELPPKTFKATFFKEVFGGELLPRICRVAARNIITLREQSGEGDWKKLYLYAMVNGLLGQETESLEIIREGQYIPALTIKEPRQADRHTDTGQLAEGIYAIFTHKGDTAAIQGLYAAVNNYWLPRSKYRAGEGTSYVIYLNNPAMVAPADLLTEIYVPLAEK